MSVELRGWKNKIFWRRVKNAFQRGTRHWKNLEKIKRGGFGEKNRLSGRKNPRHSFENIVFLLIQELSTLKIVPFTHKQNAVMQQLVGGFVDGSRNCE